jgi:hypothetical protein
MIPLDSKGFETDSLSRIVAWAMDPEDKPKHAGKGEWDEGDGDKTDVEYLLC